MKLCRSVLILPAVGIAAALLSPVGTAGARPAGASAPSGEKQTDLVSTVDAVGDSLGAAVAISGTTVVAGAPTRDGSAGAVDIFIRPTAGWGPTKQVATLTAPTAETGARFGAAVAISGRTIVVGATAESVRSTPAQGAAFVYTEPAGGWKSTSVATSELVASDGTSDSGFGAAVGVSGRTVAVGAPNAGDGNINLGESYEFTEPATGWKPTTTQTARLVTHSGTSDGEYFGGYLAVSGDTIAVSGTGKYNTAGRVYVYSKPASGVWKTSSENAQLVGADQAGARFGAGVGIEGNTIVVGAGGTAVGGYGAAGDAYVYEKPSGGWGSVIHPATPPKAIAILTADNPALDSEIGDAVAISDNVIALGAPGVLVGANHSEGVIDLYRRQGATWKSATENNEIVSSDGQALDHLGQTIGLADGVVVAGAPSHNGGAGVVDVFAPANPTLTKVSQARSSWTLGKAHAHINPAKKPRGGTHFSFRVSQSSTVSLVFVERVGKTLRAKGTAKFAARAGVNRVYFDGRIAAGKTLTAGHCAVAISASNNVGTTPTSTLSFVVHKAHRK